jgi:hypothetical protein
MVTPIMVANIGWGTYLFFAAVNACFLPVIYIFYPETKRRSLEEIDIIFAKGYVEKMSYVKAAKELPLLSDAEVEREAVRYGLLTEGERGSVSMGKGGVEGGLIRREGRSESESDEKVI